MKRAAITLMTALCAAGLSVGCAQRSQTSMATLDGRAHSDVAMAAASDPYQQDTDQSQRDDRTRRDYDDSARHDPHEHGVADADVNEKIARWPESSRKAATAMIEKYGAPTTATEHQLVWRDNGPWVYTIVSAHPVTHQFPMEHEDVLEQVIKYKVPADKFDELAQFDGSVMCERTTGWLSARCDKEEANFLALNLAHQIVTGKMTVEQARTEYAKNIKAMMDGQAPEIMQGFQFEPATGGTEDPDRPMKMN